MRLGNFPENVSYWLEIDSIERLTGFNFGVDDGPGIGCFGDGQLPSTDHVFTRFERLFNRKNREGNIKDDIQVLLMVYSGSHRKKI